MHRQVTIFSLFAKKSLNYNEHLKMAKLRIEKANCFCQHRREKGAKQGVKWDTVQKYNARNNFTIKLLFFHLLLRRKYTYLSKSETQSHLTKKGGQRCNKSSSKMNKVQHDNSCSNYTQESCYFSILW